MRIDRAADETDILSAIELGRAMHAEHPLYQRNSFDLERFEPWARLVLMPDSDTVLFLARNADDDAVGLFFGGVTPYFFSNERYGYDFGMFVEPAARGSTAALRLLHAFEDWVKAKGVNRIFVGCAKDESGAAAQRLYEASGYRHVVNGLEKIMEA